MLIKPASSLCNLRCKYCFYTNVSDLREVKSTGVMTDDTVDNLLKNIFAFLNKGDQLIIAFQGGEPTLAGLDFFEKFANKAQAISSNKNIAISYSMQTNGINLTEKFCQHLKKHNYLVGLSLDLDSSLHDLNRIDSQGEGTFKRVSKARELLEQMNVEYNILCVLSNPLAKHPEKIWKTIVNNNLKFVQFIPCLNDFDGDENSKLALQPKHFASFYSTLLPLWFNEFKNNNYISIRFFDDFFNLIKSHVVNSCGLTGSCGNQFVVESDGSVYPCDFYVLDQWKIGNITTTSVPDIMSNPKVNQFICDKSIPEFCNSCRFKQLCNGGCKRMKKEMYVLNDFCGYQKFLETNVSLIDEVLAFISK